MINTLQQDFKTKISLCLFKFTLCEVMKAWGFGATHTRRIWKLAYVRIETHNMAVCSTTAVISATTTATTAAAVSAAAAAATAHFEVASLHKIKHTHTGTRVCTHTHKHTHKHTDLLSFSLFYSLYIYSLSVCRNPLFDQPVVETPNYTTRNRHNRGTSMPAEEFTKRLQQSNGPRPTHLIARLLVSDLRLSN
jgi:hypothetical protein